MIDTIKVGIPLSESQLTKLLAQVAADEKWQWVQWHPQSGELRFMRFKGAAKVDQPSFHREIRWDIPDTYTTDSTFLTVELSLPKFAYGHNIRLLHGWVDALRDLKKQLDKQLHCRFPDVMEWQVRRLDPCYMWECPSQEVAQGLLDSLKRLTYPRKTPEIHETSIFFKGKTYSLKVYLKLPEFKIHDMKELLKQKASLEWVECLEKKATGVIRFEATLRQKFLQRKGIKTVADLVQPKTYLEWHLDSEPENFNSQAAIMMVLAYQQSQGVDYIQNIEKGIETILEDGVTLTAPTLQMEFNGHKFSFPGGGFTYRKQDNCTVILQYFLEKFIGKNKGMDELGQVKAKLLEKYKTTKATRLLGFWMHVQRLGVEDAKMMYGKHPFYRNKADLKAAGVSLLEPDLVTELDKKFVDSFQFEIPSIHSTNQFDDFKDHSNLLNEKPNAEDKP